MTKQFHPDINPGHTEKYKKINNAYSILSDKQKRKDYDASRNPRATQSARTQHSARPTQQQRPGAHPWQDFEGFSGHTRYYRYSDPYMNRKTVGAVLTEE